MRSTRARSAWVVSVCLALMLGGVVATTTPAGALAKENWSKIWKKQIMPKADRRYYTKRQSNGRFVTSGDADAKYYSRTESDGRFLAKTDADAQYQPRQAVYRGNFMMGSQGAGTLMSADISFGVTLTAPPTAHYIQEGAAVPAGCSGTATAPNADPGHLCVFEADSGNAAPGRRVTNLAYTVNTATPVGGYLWGYVQGAGVGFAAGSWAMRPSGALASGSATPSLGRIGNLTP